MVDYESDNLAVEVYDQSHGHDEREGEYRTHEVSSLVRVSYVVEGAASEEALGYKSAPYTHSWHQGPWKHVSPDHQYEHYHLTTGQFTIQGMRYGAVNSNN